MKIKARFADLDKPLEEIFDDEEKCQKIKDTLHEFDVHEAGLYFDLNHMMHLIRQGILGRDVTIKIKISVEQIGQNAKNSFHVIAYTVISNNAPTTLILEGLSLKK